MKVCQMASLDGGTAYSCLALQQVSPLNATAPPGPHDRRSVNGVAPHHTASLPGGQQALDAALQCAGPASHASPPGQFMQPAAAVPYPLAEQQHAASQLQGGKGALPLRAVADGGQGEPEAVCFFDDSAQEPQPALLGPARMRSRSVKDAARVRGSTCSIPGKLLCNCSCVAAIRTLE